MEARMAVQQPQNDLALIRRLMDEGQRAVRGDGTHFIGWGLAAAVGLVLTDLAITGRVGISVGWVWVIVLLCGWGFSLWAGWTAHETARVSTAAGRLLTGSWAGTGIGLTLLVALSLSRGVVPPAALSGIVAVLLGTGFFASSFLIGSWMTYLAIAWWSGGAALLVWPTRHAPLVLGAMLLLFQVLPGVALFTRTRSRGPSLER
jgi:hypothetical protein